MLATLLLVRATKHKNAEQRVLVASFAVRAPSLRNLHYAP